MEKKKNKLFWYVLVVLFIAFIGLYIAQMSGYYENKISQKVVLTGELIKKFETDVKEGKIVDIDAYIINDKVDYSNSITKFGNKLSDSVEVVMTKGISNVIGILKTLFW